MLTRYIVKFFKKVVAHGHEVDACQYTVDTFASDRDEAMTLAQKEFCVAEGLANWQIHADRIQVAEAEFPS
jgi:hypothetical protein